MTATLSSNNPLAQWENAWTRLFGSGSYSVIGGGNHIAQFADAISGASANVATMLSVYGGSTVADMISRWSGGNSSQAYTDFVTRQSGVSPNATVSDVLAGPQGPSFLSAMAHWEAGGPGALSLSDWSTAITQGTQAVATGRPTMPAGSQSRSQVASGQEPHHARATSHKRPGRTSSELS